ncbi:MAG: HAMP domain-containing histidine kinase [Desulfobacterales bacterium]|nr:HAMP domain-containing histidine kinase [Desulfobacterales bacterium]
MYINIYAKLIWYFAGLILLTCLISGVLFFFTVGRPIAKEGHQLIRNHVLFIAEQAENILVQGEKKSELDAFATSIFKRYKMSANILDSKYREVAGHPEGLVDIQSISEGMIREVEDKGIFVQSGHLSGRTIYLLPIEGQSGSTYYLYIYRKAATSGSYIWFLVSLGGMCLILIAGIYPLAKNFTSPIQRLSRVAEQIAAGNFKQVEVPSVRRDELGKLEDTFLKMVESVREMMASKRQLLADISHELRSPLGRMEVSLELLLENCGKNETSERHIKMLENEIRFMEGMVSALSAYSKINLPEFKLNITTVPPKELLVEIFRRNQPIMDKKSIQFQLNIGPGLPQIDMDRGRIFSVIQNLLDNARQFCPQGGEVVLGAISVGERLRFFVSDSGQGIPEEKAEKIFEPLYRIDSSRNRHTGGLGLGLAISKRIIEHHGGRIWFHRKENRTVFSFELVE